MLNGIVELVYELLRIGLRGRRLTTAQGNSKVKACTRITHVAVPQLGWSCHNTLEY